MDGVLWSDTEPIGNLPSIFNKIEALGLDFILATNNATRTVEEYQQKLGSFGLVIPPIKIVTSAMVTAQWIINNTDPASPIYVVGSDSLKSILRAHNLHVLPDNNRSGASVVVVSIDRKITYEKIDIASRYVREGAIFIATNTDLTYPTPDGLSPGSGALVAAIAACSYKTPLVIGKPEISMYVESFKRMHQNPDEVLCIGDRLETDIAGAQKAGSLTGLVLSGVSNRDQAEAWNPRVDVIAQDLEELIGS